MPPEGIKNDEELEDGGRRFSIRSIIYLRDIIARISCSY